MDGSESSELRLASKLRLCSSLQEQQAQDARLPQGRVTKLQAD